MLKLKKVRNQKNFIKCIFRDTAKNVQEICLVIQTGKMYT